MFVIHDYRVNKSLVFKGHSKKYTYSANVEEERPLFYCWHNGRFVFSSIFETLYAFYYDETVYSLPFNKLMVVRGDKLKLVKEYKREKATQSKPTTVVTTGRGGVIRWDDEDEVYPRCYNTHTNDQYLRYKIKYDGVQYTNDRKEPMHGVFRVSSYGYVFPNRKEKENWLEEVAFFKGQMLKHPKAFALINSKYTAANNQITPDIETLINMLNFNPHSEDCVQYYWYDGDALTVPTGEWKWPMADWSIVFDGEGKATKYDNRPYTGWATDYKMYTYEEDKILEAWSKICGAV